MSRSSTSGGQRIDWAALKSYIAGKEAYEAQNGYPAPISEAEASAIAVLLRPAPRPDPDIGGQDWISLLHHFLQVRRQNISFTDEARQVPGLGKAPELRWACFLTIKDTGDVFPRPGYGIDSGSPLSPDFARKQDAKQWAAKSACEWLIDAGHMLSSGELPKFPKPFGSVAAHAAASASVPAKRSPPHTPPVVVKDDNHHLARSSVASPRGRDAILPPRQPSQASPKQKPTKVPRVAAAEVPVKPASPLKTSSPARSPAMSPANGAPIRTPPEVDAEIPNTKKVTDLCKRLNFPAPRYILTEYAAIPGGDFWNGRADFESDPRLPDGLGTVQKVLTKKGARERMAGQVLEWLNSELEKRELRSRNVLDR